MNVSCEHRADGTHRPRKLILPDGRSWDIRRTLHVAETVEDEFEGIRYTVLIGSAEKYIYRMGKQWYVHPIHTEVDTS